MAAEVERVATPEVLGLAAAVAVVGSNALALSPIAPAVGASLGVDGPSVMIAASGYGLGAALAAVVGGAAVDRFGPARALRAALVTLALALAAAALAPNLTALVVAQAAAGLAAGLALPAAYAQVSAVAPAGRESAALGVVLTGWTVSMVLGVAFAAVTADAVGWRAVYAVFAAAAAVLALATPAPTDAVAQDATSPRPSVLSGARTILAAPAVAATLLACAAFMHAFYGAYAYLGDHLEGAGLSVAEAGLASVSYGVGFGLAAFGDGVIDRLGPARALLLSFCGIAVAYVALAAAVGLGPWFVVATCALWGLANHFGLNALIGRLSALQPRRRGQTLGLYTATTYLSMFSGTLLFQPIYLAAGLAAAALAAAALAALGAVLAAATRSVTAE